jgi:hypothetical protein
VQTNRRLKLDPGRDFLIDISVWDHDLLCDWVAKETVKARGMVYIFAGDPEIPGRRFVARASGTSNLRSPFDFRFTVQAIPPAGTQLQPGSQRSAHQLQVGQEIADPALGCLLLNFFKGEIKILGKISKLPFTSTRVADV